MMRRVTAALAPYVSRLLDRERILYKAAEIGSDEDGYTVYRVECSSRRFTRIVEDAKSEKERSESVDPTIPVLSYRAGTNDERMKELLTYYGADCFVVRAADSKKYCEAVKAR